MADRRASRRRGDELRVGRDRADELGGHRRVELAPAGPGDGVGPHVGVRVRRDPRHQPVGRRRELGVAVRDDQRVQPAVVEQLHAAPVGERGHRQLGDAGHRGAAVEAASQLLRRRRQELDLPQPLRTAGLGPEPQDGLRADVGDDVEQLDLRHLGSRGRRVEPERERTEGLVVAAAEREREHGHGVASARGSGRTARISSLSRRSTGCPVRTASQIGTGSESGNRPAASSGTRGVPRSPRVTRSSPSRRASMVTLADTASPTRRVMMSVTVSRSVAAERSRVTRPSRVNRCSSMGCSPSFRARPARQPSGYARDRPAPSAPYERTPKR